MTAPSYYGCTANHSEFTCLSQYYQTTGRRRHRYAKWCESCKAKYKEPDNGRADAVRSETGAA